VDQVNRTNCKKCRFEKCLRIGMKPHKVAKRKKKAEETLKAADIGKQEKDSPKQDLSSRSSTSSNYSYDGSFEDCFGELEEKTVDIAAIAEECVLEEIERNDVRKQTFSENFELVNFCTLTCDIIPVMELTFEEEFRIHELDVMKENMLDGFFKFLSDRPQFLERVTTKLISMSLGLCIDQISDKILDEKEKLRNCIENDYIHGGKIRMLLDSFYVFKSVPDEVRAETFQFSLSVVVVCFRAFFKANSDKEYFIDQKRAAGLFNPSFQQMFDQIFSNNRYAVRSMNVYGPDSLFKSGWARQQSDEEMFSHTMQTLGEIVRDDITMGTLYITLVLATPGEELSHQAKTCPALVKVQHEISLLIYRYLKNKYRDAGLAEHKFNMLLK